MFPELLRGEPSELERFLEAELKPGVGWMDVDPPSDMEMGDLQKG